MMIIALVEIWFRNSSETKIDNEIQMSLCYICSIQTIIYQFKIDVAAWKRLMPPAHAGNSGNAFLSISWTTIISWDSNTWNTLHIFFSNQSCVQTGSLDLVATSPATSSPISYSSDWPGGNTSAWLPLWQCRALKLSENQWEIMNLKHYHWYAGTKYVLLKILAFTLVFHCEDFRKILLTP